MDSGLAASRRPGMTADGSSGSARRIEGDRDRAGIGVDEDALESLDHLIGPATIVGRENPLERPWILHADSDVVGLPMSRARVGLLGVVVRPALQESADIGALLRRDRPPALDLEA